ncbi:MAG: DUF2089 domain-containing protein [Chloroflexi bacterium]|nr:DUF2089 domain-containing protein [Chloroflexota bacterium]OJW02038.1 MAG: hypothetical protein BGO39_27510 [Chloroflexi bacterium 54-19]
MATIKHNVSGVCPICNEQMYIERLHCENCDSALEGKFNLGPFQRLTPDQLQFLEVFIRCRGQNKAVQETLNISYPTVVKKLDELILGMGYEPVVPVPVVDQRREVLEMLSQGRISAAQAQQLLAGQPKPAEAENRPVSNLQGRD